MIMYTIGHSNRKINSFIEILDKFLIARLIDIRTYPYSEYVPEYNRENLQKTLKESGIEYCYLGDKLGGRPLEGFSKYRKSETYTKVLNELLIDTISSKKTVGLMCAEKDYTRCHRRFVSEDLEKIILANKYNLTIEHIFDENKIDKTLDQFMD